MISGVNSVLCCWLAAGDVLIRNFSFFFKSVVRRVTLADGICKAAMGRAAACRAV